MAQGQIVKKILIKIVKIVGWVFLTIFSLLIILILLIRLPSIQNKITKEAISFLQNKIKTKVELESLYISFPKSIVLEGLYLEDQSADTLIYIQSLSINTDLWGLTQNRIQLNSVTLEKTIANIKREKETGEFNFDFIIDAFSDSTTQDTTATAWEFSLGSVELSKIKAAYHDEFEDNYIDVALGELELTMDKFNLAESIFRISELELANSVIDIKLAGSAEEDSKSSVSKSKDTKPLSLDFENIHLDSVRVSYRQKQSGQKINLIVGDFEIEANKIDLPNQLIDLDKIEMSNTFIAFHQQPTGTPTASQSTEANNENPLPWDIKLASLALLNNSFQFDNGDTINSTSHFDPNHLWLYDINTAAKNIEVKGIEGKIDLENLSLHDKSGFVIQSLKGKIDLGEKYLTVEDFLFATKDSRLELAMTSSFASIDEVIQHYEQAQVNVNIDNSYITLHDVLFFSPSLLDSIPLSLKEDFRLNISTKLKGSVSDLAIEEFNVKMLDSTQLKINGTVKGLPDVKTMTAQLNIETFYTTKYDVLSILPDTLVPPSVQVPDWIRLAGNMNGTMKSPTVKVTLTSDVGTVKVNGTMTTGEIEKYNIALTTEKLNVGKILKQPKVMGLLDMKASLKGKGLSMDVLNAEGEVEIARFEYNDYVYKDFLLKGAFDNYLFKGEASLHDKNLDFVLEGDMDYQKEVPLYKLTFDLKNADLNALHLSERLLRARATLDVELATKDFKSINGNIGIRHVAIYNGDALYRVDSLLFASLDQEGQSEISIRSDIVSGDFKGTFNIFTLPKILKQNMNRYFSLQDTLVGKFESPQNFKFGLTIKNTDLITEILVPDLEPFRPGIIEGEFDSEKNILKLNIEFADVKYSTVGADSVSLTVDGDKNALRYKVRFRNIEMDTMNIPALQLNGKVENDSIVASLSILDSLFEEKYHLGVSLESQDKAFLFHFIPDQVLLNYEAWRVPDDNQLRFNNSGFKTKNLVLSKENEKLSIITTEGDSSTIIRFDRFQLANLTKILSGKVPADGVMDGDVQLFKKGRGAINSKLEIADLTVFDKMWGDLVFSVTKKNSTYQMDLGLKGDDMNLKALGNYQADEKKYMINVDLDPLNLVVLEPLSGGQLKNVKGIARGKVTVESVSGNPVINGKINFSGAQFLLGYLNNTFSLDDQSLEFRNSNLLFSNFELKDVSSNKATINGSVMTETFSSFDLDLRVSATNFQLLDTKEGDNEMYYGKLKVNSNATIKGTSLEPKITMSVKVGEGSNLTYVVPISEKEVMERKGIVKFVDRDAVKDPFLANLPDLDTIHSLYKGINLTANIELTDKALLTIVIDPATGDKLSVNGNASLVLDMDASGAMSLSGRYDLTDGTYNFSFYNFTKREFSIERGSSIVWSGDPLNATLDIRARYDLETSPLDLVSNQINPENQDEINRYSQRLPFIVYLLINGRLLEPQISFSLDMPENKRSAFGGSIYAKIQDINTRESDLNKQVFALLILKRFISDNPFESQAATSVNNTARQSVSRLLSDQLNRLSENVKGVQLNIDIKSYEDRSGAQVEGETKVQLGVTKNLFNDRLVVKLSGNVDVEGGDQSQGSFTDYIGDIALEYKLTSDGRFRISGFRDSNYDMIDGELTETGVGLIYIKDYNTLRELLRSNAKE